MSPKIFSIAEREEVKTKLLNIGFELIKANGMTHASVEKITKAAGIGKSTFYNFFLSKEVFVSEIISYQRDKSKQLFMDILGEREKMSIDEAKVFFERITINQDSIYRYLTAEDLEKLKSALPSDYVINYQVEEQTMNSLFSHIDGIRADIDLKIVANLMKIMAISSMNKDSLHTEALDKTFKLICGTLFDYICK